MRSGQAPLEVTARLMCRWRDGDFERVRVVERRKLEGPGHVPKGDASDWEYYVHYERCACLCVPVRACVPVPCACVEKGVLLTD